MPLPHKRVKLFCVSSGRSDAFIWLPVWRAVTRNPNYDLWIAKTGMHASNEGTKLYDEFVRANIVEVGCDLGGDQAAYASNAMAASAARFSKIFNSEKPDALFVLGDRMDMLPAVFSSLPYNIPCIHLHGGEYSKGAIDDRIRHAVSMMSSLHFVAHVQAKEVIKSFGKSCSSIHVVGAPGLDNIKSTPVEPKDALLRALGIPVNKEFFVGTVHSETNSRDPVRTLLETLKAIERLDSCNVVFTHSNSDPCNIVINDILQRANREIPHFHFVPKLGYEQYVNLMRHSVAVIGNSSSGLIEAPFLRKRALNIGDRQLGRVADKHVQHCPNESEQILLELNILLKKKNYEMTEKSLLYGDGDSSERIVSALNKMAFHNLTDELL